MQIDVINLDRSIDRFAEFRSVNGHIKTIIRNSAVEGSSEIRRRLIQEGVLAGPLPLYTDGAIGCAISHLKQWNKAIDEQRVVTVAEDDALLHADFERQAVTVIAALPKDWDIVLWGWNFDSYLVFEMIRGVATCHSGFNQDELRKNISGFQSAEVTSRPYKLLKAFGTVSYSVTPKGAQVMKALCLPIRDMSVFLPGLNWRLPNKGIDIVMNSIYPRIRAFVAFPPQVITRNEHATSTVQARRSGAGSDSLD